MNVSAVKITSQTVKRYRRGKIILSLVDPGSDTIYIYLHLTSRRWGISRLQLDNMPGIRMVYIIYFISFLVHWTIIISIMCILL